MKETNSNRSFSGKTWNNELKCLHVMLLNPTEMWRICLPLSVELCWWVIKKNRNKVSCLILILIMFLDCCRSFSATCFPVEFRAVKHCSVSRRVTEEISANLWSLLIFQKFLWLWQILVHLEWNVNNLSGGSYEDHHPSCRYWVIGKEEHVKVYASIPIVRLPIDLTVLFSITRISNCQ